MSTYASIRQHGKYEETSQIIQLIGTKISQDYNTGIYQVKSFDGRILKVADLVEDDAKERNLMQKYLQQMKRREDIDIIIALGTAKEGFDWPWCEMCLTIGVRGSLTEIIQIIGRCTRDCEGKEEARFVNLIAMPDAQQAEVKVAVNDFLKAISASLLMEQVMAPSWNFRTVMEDEKRPRTPRDITVEGLKPLSSERTRLIVEQQLDDLKASILQNDEVQKAIAGATTAENLTKHLIPKIIREHHPDLSNDEVEEIRQRVLLDTIVKGNDVEESEGNRLLKLSNQFINIDKLSINLIDTINPFQRAYQVLSKSVDAPTLKVIQDTIAEQKFNLTIEQAITIFKGPLKEYVARQGKEPSADDPNPQVREMAAALQKIKNLKIRRMKGLEYE